MTLEQAMEVLISRYNSGVIRSRTNDGEWRLATDAVIVALRGPEPDPETGLVPCGCGGKAEICGSSGDDESYSLECWECGTSSRCYDTKKEAKAAWNRAMGYKEEVDNGTKDEENEQV